MRLLLSFLWKNRKSALFSFVGIFILTAVFSITLGAKVGYHKIYKSIGSKNILAVYEGNIACPYISLVPERYAPAILNTPHVIDIAGEVRQRYSYENDQNLTLLGIDPDKLLKFKDIEVSEAEFESFKTNINAALVGRKIYNCFNWKIGQVINTFGLTFKIAGVFDMPLSVYESMVILHKDYLQQITAKRGYVTAFLIKTDLKEGDIKSLIQDIEAIFKDYPSRIVCRPEGEFWQAIKASQGNLGDIIFCIVLSVGILLVILHINNALFTFRQKIESIKMLKKLGFSRNSIACLVFCETAAVSILSGIMAVIICYFALIKHPYVGSDMFHPPIFINLQVVIVVVLVSLFSGLLAALITIPSALKEYDRYI